MRLAYVCTDPGVPVFGLKGCSVHVREVLRALLDLGIEVVLFARRFDGDPPPELEAIPVRRLSRLPKQDDPERERAAIAANDALGSELERAGPFDLVYERYSLWSFAAMDYARAAGIPGLLEVNAPLIEEQAEHRQLRDRAAAESASARAFRSATSLVAVSKEVAEYLRDFTGAADRIHVVPNGVDPQRFEDVAPTLAAEPGVFTVGFVGSLRPWHGLPILVDAFARLRATDRATRLVVVGDGPERSKLVADLSTRGLGEAVKLVGPVAPDEVPGWLASLDAAVAPYPNLSHFYFSPLKVYEYMAAGRALVASEIGQLRELIEPEVNGLLCPPGDAAAIAIALGRLRHDPALRRRLGRAARATIRKGHTWDRVVRRLLALAEVPATKAPRAVGATP